MCETLATLVTATKKRETNQESQHRDGDKNKGRVE